MKVLVIFFIRFYQKCISPFLGNHCRFFPSCSEYARLCFMRFPFHLGVWLTFRRIFKCHPFHAGGIDPVPPMKEL